jgi:hypothetical protein
MQLVSDLYPLSDSDHPDSFQVQSESMKELFDDYLNPPLDIVQRTENGAELISRALPFARSENGDFLFWDTGEPLSDGEYPIYLTDFSGGINLAGNALDEVIKNLIHPDHFRSVLFFHNKPLESTFKCFRQLYYE